MTRVSTAVLAACLMAGAVRGQVFEVASVKPNHSGSGRVMINTPDSGRLVTENTSLKMLITFAYDIRDTQLSGGPAWLDSDRWDIVAKPEVPVARGMEGAPVMRAMMRNLLEDRFHLKVHKESKEMPVYALVVAKGGPKLMNSVAEKGPMMRMGMGTLEGTKVQMGMLARALSGPMQRAVIDETGLKGDYDLKLTFAPEAGMFRGPGPGGPEHPEASANESERPTLAVAVQEQLGLRLESKHEPVETIVVDSAEKPGEN